MNFDLTFILIVLATVVNGLLAGGSLDKALVQLPARKRMGIVGFAAFSRANDLGNGLVVYPVAGILAALLSLAAAISAYFQGSTPAQAWPLYVAALLALLHSFTTARAAPNMLSLRKPGDDEALLTQTLDRFAAWHNLRAVLQVLNFVMLVWALITYLTIHP